MTHPTSPPSRRLALAAAAGLGLSVLTLLTPPALAQTASTAPLKIGVLYHNPIGAEGWVFQHHSGVKEMQAALGNKVQVQVVENVAEGPDGERVMRQLARDGNQLIFTPSFGYMDATIKVAAEFPNVKFVNATGYKQAANVGTFSARFFEARYLMGVLAGHMAKSGKAGYVAAFPIPEVLQGINAFTLGMRSVNPKAEVRVVWVNTWFDPPRETQAAQSLLNQGVDVLANHTNSPAVVTEAEKAGRYAVAYQSDMSKFGPKAHLSAVVHNWGPYYTKAAQDVLAGTWKSSDTWGTYAQGFLKIAPFNPAVPAPVRQAVLKLESDLKAGQLAVFKGPIKDNEGKTRLAAGAVMADADIQKMDFYVEGVVGKVPK